MIDIRQSVNYANHLKTQGWIVERRRGINYFIRKIPIIGSVLKIQRPKKIDFREIEKLSKKHRVFQIIFEPDLSLSNSTFTHNQLLSHGFSLSKSPFLPTKTIHIDLTKPIKAIYADFSKKCRYSIRKGERLIIKEYRTPLEIKIFRKAWKKSVNFNRFVPSVDQLIQLRKTFNKNYSLFLASHNKFSRIIGGVIFTISSHGTSNYISYYWHSFTNSEGRSSLSQYSLLYQGILWAKRMGCKTFDMEGIYDERFPNKSWLGFTHFKKSFGGKEILYPGTYVKYRFSI